MDQGETRGKGGQAVSRQPGRMGLGEGVAIVFITTFAPVFLSAWTIALDRAATALWMLPVINCLGGFAALFLLLYALNCTGGDLYSACQELVGVVPARLIAASYVVLFFLDAALLLRQFAENTLLTALPYLPFEIGVGWFAAAAAAVVYVGIEPVARAGYLALPMVIFAGFAVLALLGAQYQPLYLAPWQGPGLAKVLIAGVQGFGVNLGVIIPPILAVSFQNARTIRSAVLYGLGLSAFIKSVTMAAYIAAFGVETAREKVLPFYELARLVYVNRFIQRIEALAILLWAVMGILGIAIEVYAGLYLLGRLFRLPTVRPLIVPALLTISVLGMLPGEITGVIAFHFKMQTTVYIVGTSVIPLVLFCAAALRARRRKTC